MPHTPAADRYTARTNDGPSAWFRRCGASGLKLPALSLGCWHNFGDPGTDSQGLAEPQLHANAQAMLFAAFDHGITHFDLANNYGPAPGSAETRVGRVLKNDLAGYRDQLIISTKAGYGMWPGPYGDGGSRKYLLSSLDQSLARLQLDHVDLFYIHRFDADTPLEETLGALDHAVRSGKALYTGISNFNATQTRDALHICKRDGLTPPIIHQPSYSMLDRWIEPDLLDAAGTLGLGVIPFCPLAQGLLTDRYLSAIPTDSRAKTSQFLTEDRIDPAMRTRLNTLNAIAHHRGQSLAQLALAWVLRDPRVTSALIGASRPAQILDNLAAAEKTVFDSAELAAIEAALG